MTQNIIKELNLEKTSEVVLEKTRLEKHQFPESIGFTITPTLAGDFKVQPILFLNQKSPVMDKKELSILTILVSQTISMIDLEKSLRLKEDQLLKIKTNKEASDLKDEIQLLKDVIKVKREQQIKGEKSGLKELNRYTLRTTYRDIADELEKMSKNKKVGDSFRVIKKTLESLKAKGFITSFYVAPITGTTIELNAEKIVFENPNNIPSVSGDELDRVLALAPLALYFYPLLKMITSLDTPYEGVELQDLIFTYNVSYKKGNLDLNRRSLGVLLNNYKKMKLINRSSVNQLKNCVSIRL